MVIECPRCHEVMVGTSEEKDCNLYKCYSCGYWLKQYFSELEVGATV